MDESIRKSSLEHCPVCGAREFKTEKILWSELIQQWGLSAQEAAYIDLQQGYRCARCKNNLRSMTLAAAMTSAFGFAGSFEQLCLTNPQLRALKVLEVNAAGTLSRYLELLPRHARYNFPELDLQRMSFDDASFDLIIHSDTLEHVPDSARALKESHRVLRPGGHLFYSVPIVVGRMTRSRHGLPPSYHGKPDAPQADYIVQTEYGADFWCELFAAGFPKICLTSLMFPASLAICASKV